MISWFTLTLLGMLCVATADISQRLSLKGESPLSSITNNFIVWNGIGLLALIYFIATKQPLPIIPQNFFWEILPMTVLYFLGGSFYYQSFKSNSVSISAVLAMISSVVTTVLGIALYGESLSLQKLIGSLIVLGAIIIVSIKKNQRFDKYNLYALLGGIFYGFAYTLDKHFVIATDPNFYQIVLCFAVGLSSLIFSPKRIISELKLYRSDLTVSILSSIFFFFLYQKFYFWAYTIGGEVGRIDVLNNSTIFLIILFEYLILKEKSDLPKKIACSVIVVVGATLLATA